MELRENETVIGIGQAVTDGRLTTVDIFYGNCILLSDGKKGALPQDTYRQLLDAYLAEHGLPEDDQADFEQHEEDETVRCAELDLLAQSDPEEPDRRNRQSTRTFRIFRTDKMAEAGCEKKKARKQANWKTKTSVESASSNSSNHKTLECHDLSECDPLRSQNKTGRRQSYILIALIVSQLLSWTLLILILLGLLPLR